MLTDRHIVKSSLIKPKSNLPTLDHYLQIPLFMQTEISFVESQLQIQLITPTFDFLS